MNCNTCGIPMRDISIGFRSLWHCDYCDQKERNITVFFPTKIADQATMLINTQECPDYNCRGYYEFYTDRKHVNRGDLYLVFDRSSVSHMAGENIVAIRSGARIIEKGIVL